MPGTTEKAGEEAVTPEMREVLTEEEIGALLESFGLSPVPKERGK
ncbi:MAG: hypothetical protein PWQ41_1035 [Bacillota bacterium]|nr:hypothetical protein [Bacillota bacterium]MDK2925261.1 hypothetical protein [Bacillota bacterium]MDK2960461.1 hypothetical protein [Bacillota bacterium]